MSGLYGYLIGSSAEDSYIFLNIIDLIVTR
jgi:hypothetical protein